MLIVGLILAAGGGIYYFLMKSAKKISLVKFDILAKTKNLKNSILIATQFDIKNDSGISFKLKNIDLKVLKDGQLLAESYQPEDLLLSANSTTKFKHDVDVKNMSRLIDLRNNNEEVDIVLLFTFFFFDFHIELKQKL